MFENEIWLQLGVAGAIALYTIKTLGELLGKAIALKKARNDPDQPNPSMTRVFSDCRVSESIIVLERIADTQKQTAELQRVTLDRIESVKAEQAKQAAIIAVIKDRTARRFGENA